MLDLNKIKFLPSPNASKRTRRPDYIVLHTPCGSFLGCCVWFRNPKSRVSAHYVVSRKAEMVCMVRPEDKAWHVNNFNNRAIGIEIEDYDSATKEHCKTLPIWWTDVQLKAVAELCIALMKEFKITSEHIIGHNNPMLRVYGNTHVDPKNFPWEKFRALIKEIQDEGSKN